MLPHYKKITLLLTILVLGGCSSKKSDEIEPTSSSLPKKVKVETYGGYNGSTLYTNDIAYVWKGNILTSYTLTRLESTTNKEIDITFEFTRNNKNLITSEKLTYDGGKGQITDYKYNTDGTEITLGTSKKWIYNDKGQAIKIVYTNEGIDNYSIYSYGYDSNGQLTHLGLQQDSYETINYLTEFTTVKNPLYILSEKTQFLHLSPFLTDNILYCSKMIPKSFKDFSYGIKDLCIVTHSLDDQQRVSTMTVTYDNNVLNRFTFGY
ncbi:MULTISPECIES: hypothetical protein [unclassified Arcicella]|uniref:hypothetical protein n=1 Tax=unclassified Arcicella TaxID=2644986 RepID=UPI002856EEFA|nr:MULTISPECIES: hypothetical protein [unclassified Arcicella]MDR6564625.1 hypothetical protein [Arcicella sp. BE51]MDR6814447.1 hypothetical protein [Arcicella sp. BE140]MDR6825797.1 hypothetical protein [Arcicella sp. BE139]